VWPSSSRGRGRGYTLTEDGEARVRGIWRFYTARDTNWDTLVRSNRTDSATVESDAIPVYVHAYPSRIGPRAEPVRDGPELIETWGTDRPSPVGTIGENINIDIVNRSYTTTYGVAVRAETIDREALHVAGIVRGVNASIVEPDGALSASSGAATSRSRSSNRTSHRRPSELSYGTIRPALQSRSTIAVSTRLAEPPATGTSPSQISASRPTNPALQS